MNAKSTNEKNRQEAEKQVKKNQKILEEKYDLDVKVMNIESQMREIEMYDNTVTYPLVKPMTYLIFYTIGGAIFGLGAFIIYLVR